MRTLPSSDPVDPGYRRLRYLKYADDHILGLTGPKAGAEQIKARIALFLRETLGLELNTAKTLITRARSKPARFFGYHIIVQHRDTQQTGGRRTANGNIALRVRSMPAVTSRPTEQAALKCLYLAIMSLDRLGGAAP